MWYTLVVSKERRQNKMTKIDKRKSYFLVFDTETTNGLDDPIMYDLGGAVIDKKGKVYETFSLIIDEVFNGMKDLMQSAYYAKKIPMYEEQIAKGERKVVSMYEARKIFQDLLSMELKYMTLTIVLEIIVQ